MLAVACRAENNRYWLRRGVMVRPGYQGNWVEFTIVGTNLVLEWITEQHMREMS